MNPKFEEYHLPFQITGTASAHFWASSSSLLLPGSLALYLAVFLVLLGVVHNGLRLDAT